MLTGLAQIHASLLALEGQIHASLLALAHDSALSLRGLDVTVFDPDTVSAFNVGRQLFYLSDVGKNKAEVLVSRVNVMYGTKWKGIGRGFHGSEGGFDLVITAVDTAKARREIHRELWKPSYSGEGCAYWLDCGNLATVGHVILGQPGREGETGWPGSVPFRQDWTVWKGQKEERREGETKNYRYWTKANLCEIRLPCVTEMHPEMLDESLVESDEPSCFMVEALGKQSLFVNRTVSAYALDLMWELLREGRVTNQGVVFNLRTRRSEPIPLKVWPLT